MKLWQKIFLGTLALMVLATSTLTLLFLKNSRDMLWQQELQRALTQQQYVARLLKTSVVSTRLQDGQLFLDAAQTDDAALAALTRQQNDAYLLQSALYRNGEPLSDAVPGCDASLAPADGSADGQTLYRFDISSEGAYLLASLPVVMEQQQYRLVCRFAVDECAVFLQRQSSQLRGMALGASLACATLLLAVVGGMLRPLGTLSRRTRQIAQGDYSQRLAVVGRDELAGLAQDMNRMAEAVQQRVAQLEQAAQNQKTFTANMAHEMKTPLTSILGFADLLYLQKEVPDDVRTQYAGIIVEETRRLRSLSGKLMELLAVENKNLVLEPVSLPELFREVGLAVQPLVAQTHLKFQQFCEPMTVRGDKELLKSLLYNFLDNGRKASPAGSRLILAGRRRSAPQGPVAEICVRDFGHGIPEKELEKVRQPFYMVDKSRARKAGGAGLGLALCETIARIHGGSFTIDSRTGQGTLITLYLPLWAGDSPKEAADDDRS